MADAPPPPAAVAVTPLFTLEGCIVMDTHDAPVPGVGPEGEAAFNTFVHASGAMEAYEYPVGEDVLRVLSIGEWSYPLVGQQGMKMDVPPESTVLDYVFPTEDRTTHFLLRIPVAGGSDVERVLCAFTQLKDARGELVPPPPTTSARIGQGIMHAGERVAQGLVAGATVVGSGLLRGSAYLRTKISPKEKPVEVSARTKTIISSTRTVADTAVVMSSAAVSAVTMLAVQIGSAVSDHFGDTSLGKSLASKTESETGKAVKTVALSSIVALGSVWDGIDKAARRVATDTATASHEVIEHRYGAQAGAAAKDVGEAGTQLVKATLNMKRVGLKPLVKASARHAARETLAKDAPVPPPRAIADRK